MFKKIFSGFVSATTIAWSVGAGALALPSVASAATAGDLVKASGPAVYYYHTDGKRYVFPNEKTYFSWFKDFSSVKTISDSELASIFVGGNVTVRPGTYLAKVTTDPKVYAVSHDGKFHWIESEAIAKALYGDNWAQRVIDVPDAFFINYTVGASISTAVHPDGTVVSKDGSKWVIASGKARMIASDAVFASNGYNAAFTIPTTIAYTADSSVTAREGRLADVIFGAGTPVSGNITVALASDTPAGMTVPNNASSVMLAKYNFTAGSTDAMVTGLRIRRVGVGATSDLANVYLYDANGTRLTTGRTINSQTNEVEFNGLNIAISAGQTKALVVSGDFAGSAISATGGQHSFQVINSSAVISGGVVSGSFPVAGNVFTVGTIQAGRLDIQKGTTPTNPTLGASEAEISNFKLTANTNDIEVRRITLLQAGSISSSDLTNFKLYTGATLVASTASLAGDKIVLNFTTPYIITNGTTKTFSLKANVAGRTGRTIRTYVEYTTDIYAVDKLYNSGASVCINNDGGCSVSSAAFDGTGADFIEVTTQGGALSIAYNGPATANIAKGSQDVVLFKLSINNSESDVEVRDVDFTIESAAGDIKSGGVELFRDIKIKDLDTGLTWMGPVSYPTSPAVANGDSSVDITLSDSRVIPAGKTMNLAITADIANSTDANFIDEQYRVVLGDGSEIFDAADVRVNSTSEFLAVSKIIPNSPITGNYMTVKESSLSVALAASPSASIAVKKQQMIPTAGFVLSAGAQSDVTVRSVKLSGRGDNTGNYEVADLAEVVTACDLYDGATKVGTTQSIDTLTGQIQISNMDVKIAQGSSKTLVVKCTADSTVDQVGGDNFAVGIALPADIVAEDGDSNSITPTLTAGVTGNAGAAPSLAQNVKNGGVVTIAADNLRQSTILVADGSTWQNVASYKATAQYEEVTIDRVRVIGTGDSASFASIAVAQNGAVKGEDVLSAGMNQSKDIVLSTPIIVPKDGSTTFQIWTKIANVEGYASNAATSGIARSGATVQAGIEYNVQVGEWDANYAGDLNVRLIGSASGDRLYAASGANINGNSFVVRKTKPTVTRQALSSTTLVDGSNDLYKLQISADAAGSVAVKKLTFTVTNSGVDLNNFRIRKGSTDININDVVITDEAGNDLEGVVLYGGSNVIVSFVNEETISGAGSVYTLAANVAGAGSGDSVSASLTRDLAQPIVSGYITAGAFGGFEGPNLDAVPYATIAAAGASDTVGHFIWSDNSEVPHSAALSTSRDWTNDTYVEDLTQSQTLTR